MAPSGLALSTLGQKRGNARRIDRALIWAQGSLASLLGARTLLGAPGLTLGSGESYAGGLNHII